MLRFLPATASVALELGCGAGQFALSLKKKYRAEVWGVEANGHAAQSASQILDRVLVGDVHRLIRELPKNYFDLIVCNDILEHLANPYQVLTDLRNVMQPDGSLVCSIPNIRYWPALKHIVLEGDFKYEKWGIFDITHLRFFTKKSIIRMFSEYGYQLEKIEGINPLESVEFETVNRLFGNALEDARYMQYACVAKKS